MNVQRRKVLKAGLASAATCMFAPFALARETQHLNIVHNQDFAPFEYQNGQGVDGLLPDVLDVVFKGIKGVDLIHEPLPWKRAQALVSNSYADGLSAFMSQERKKYLYFNKTPLTILKPRLFFSATHPRVNELKNISSLEDLKKFDVVDLMGNHWAEQVVAPHAPVKWFPHFEQIFKVILSNRFDVHVALSHEMIDWHLDNLGYEKERLISHAVPELPKEVPIHFGLRKGLPRCQEILAQVDKQLQKSQTEIKALKNKYFTV